MSFGRNFMHPFWVHIILDGSLNLNKACVCFRLTQELEDTEKKLKMLIEEQNQEK